MKPYKFLTDLMLILFISVVAFFIYGFVTDCPKTAGYVYCARPE